MKQNKAILCIDDEKIILDSLKSQLKSEFHNKYVLEFAQSAQEGFEIIDDLSDESINILIIVSDWLMPQMRGDEFLIEVHKRFPKVVKVMLTGQADKEAIERAEREANLFRCLYKPWTKEDLINTIKEGLKLT